MRLIDADALCEGRVCNDPVVIAAKCAPTIDAEPVRPATYNASGDCTNCGYPMPIEDKRDVIFPGEVKYCYHCGAKMDGGGEE